jgi:hypothetical protein
MHLWPRVATRMCSMHWVWLLCQLWYGASCSLGCVCRSWGVPEVVSPVHGTKQDDLNPTAYVWNGDCQQHSQQVTSLLASQVRLVTHRAIMCSTCPRVA